MRVTQLFWNTREQRLRSLWRLLAHTVIGAALILAGSIVVAAVLRDAAVAPIVDRPVQAIAGSVLIAARLLDRRPLRDMLATPTVESLRDVVAGCLIGASAMLGLVAILLPAGWAEVSPALHVTREDMPGFALTISLVGILYALSGAAEEMLSRGYHLRNMAEGMGGLFGRRAALIGAVVLSSLVFAGLHLTNQHASAAAATNIVLGGLWLGLACALTGRLALPIGLHVGWNVAQGPLLGMPISGSRALAEVFETRLSGPAGWTGGAFGPEGGLLGSLGILIGALLTLVWVRTTRGRLTLHLGLARYRRRARG